MLENSKQRDNNIGQIVGTAINNEIIKKICIQNYGLSLEKIKETELEFCRVVGYCILFKDSKDIEEYMMINNKDDQISYLKKKIAKYLEIPEEEIQKNKDKIIEFIFVNFKENGYVFHAANSLSVKEKMIDGLSHNISNEKQKRELLYIESIYRKYAPDNLYSPIGHASTDIIKNKNGWFFDGFPIHSMNYANSPQWFAYLCGKSYVYFDSIPEEKRNAYANRDYKAALNAVLWLIKRYRMTIQDAKVFLSFFQKTWNEYRYATPCLMFVPVNQVGVNENIKMGQYLNDSGMEILLNDVIEGKVNPGKNYCCNKKIPPSQLSFVDLAQLLPRFQVEKEGNISELKDKSIVKENISEER